MNRDSAQDVRKPGVLTARVHRLEDVEAIRRLKCAYAYRFDEFVNSGTSCDALISQFSPGASWSCAQFGTYVGKSALREFFEEYRSRISFSLHFITGHLIDFTGPDEAIGRWTLWQPMTVDGNAMILAGWFDERYVRADPDQWRFRDISLKVRILAKYRVGWAEKRIDADWIW